MIKTVKQWWEKKQKPTDEERRKKNPHNLKGGIDTINDYRKKQKKLLDEIPSS